LIRTLDTEKIGVSEARITLLLNQAVAIFDRPDFDPKHHVGNAALFAELIFLLARTNPTAARSRLASLQQHHQPEARQAAQEAREKLSPNPVRHIVRVMRSGGGMSALRPAQRIVYFAAKLEAEVSNGGWLQWFANSSGAHARETLEALRELGADVIAGELQKCLDILGPDAYLPEQSRRKAAIDRMMRRNRSLPDESVVYRHAVDLKSRWYDYAERSSDFFS
jgi:hypothetical protein